MTFLNEIVSVEVFLNDLFFGCIMEVAGEEVQCHFGELQGDLIVKFGEHHSKL